MTYEVAFPVQNELGEGPVWDDRAGCLIWCDILGQTLFIGDGESGLIRTYGFGEPVSAAFLSEANQLYVAGASGLYMMEPETGTRQLVIPIEQDNPVTRANDSRVAPGGAIWFGTMGRKLEADAGAVYHIKNNKIETLFAPVSIPNATCFSPDGRTGYFCDTPKQRILQVDLNPETGRPVAEARLFVDLSAEGLNPDGAVIDAEGCLWNAQWGAGRVAGYDPNGRFMRAIELPATQVTCPAFGGADLKTLYTTSAKEGLSTAEQADQPLAGAVFAVEMEVAGLAERRVPVF